MVRQDADQLFALVIERPYGQDRHAGSAADVGQTVSVTVTASNSAGTESATSVGVRPVIPATPVSTSPPAISGNVEHRDVLSVS